MTSRILRGALCLVACLITLIAPAAARADGDEISIKYLWKAGQTERYDMTQTAVSRIKSENGANQAQTTQIHNSTVRLEIPSVDESGVADARWTVEKVRIEIRQIIGEPMVLDSADPAHRENRDAGPLFAMIDRTVSFKISPAGEVSDVSGVEPVLNELIARYKDDPNSEAILETLRQGFSDEQMRQQISQTLSVLPPKPVRVGESWEKVNELPVPIIGKVRNTETVTLVAVHEIGDTRQAEIRSNAIMKPVEQAEDAAMKMGDSSAKHELLFNITKGLIQSYVIESEMLLTGTPEGGQPTIAEITTKTSLKLVE